MNKFVGFYSNNRRKILIISSLLLVVLFLLPIITTKRMGRNTAYSTKENVALYIMQYHEVPQNFITVHGRDYMEKNGISLNGYIIGGDTHANTGTLASFGVKSGTALKECDIIGSTYNITGGRGGQRLVYTCNTGNVRVFYSYDHYHTFRELTRFELQLASNILWIVFGCYAIAFIVLIIYLETAKRKAKPSEQIQSLSGQIQN